MDKPNTEKVALNTELLTLYDEFAEFHYDCAFLCDALACLIAEEDGIDYITAIGASRFSCLIKHKIEKLKKDLKNIHEKASHQY